MEIWRDKLTLSGMICREVAAPALIVTGLPFNLDLFRRTPAARKR